MLRHLLWGIALQVGIFSIFSIGIGIRSRHIDICCQRCFRFQFNTTSTNLARGNLTQWIRRVGSQVVSFGQLIQRTCHHNWHIFWHILHASFILLTL
ncbi:hypothetical protein D3C76_1218260 [compost metagenome]